MIADNATISSENEDEMLLAAPPVMAPEAFYGILRKFKDIGDVNSEASSVAVTANAIAFFCASIGRSVCQWIGDNKIHCRPFFLLSGKSGRSRKGTAEGLSRRVFERVDEICTAKNPGHKPLNIHGGGLSSGEGICHAIRDPSGNDPGNEDKRLLVVESEFANTLANARRESSTLSPIIRNVFDGRTIAPLTKNNRICATDPHVVIIGHITCDELKKMTLKSGEATNGFLNRFLICHVIREKFIPHPEVTPQSDIDLLANGIIEILEFISQKKAASSEGEIEVTMSEDAKNYWSAVYADISQDSPGISGSLVGRSEVYCRMLAMVFALFDKTIVIEVVHIKAAMCWISYVKKSVWNIFGNIDCTSEADASVLAGKILELLQHKPMSKTEISKSFNNHKASKQIKSALEFLLNQSPARITQTEVETNGRPKVIYTAK